MAHFLRGAASLPVFDRATRFGVVAVILLAFAASGCGTTATTSDGDVVDLDGVDFNDIDLDGVDVDQDTLSKLDVKADTIGNDVDAAGADAVDSTDTADIAAGCTSTAACDDGNPCTDDSCAGEGTKACVNAPNAVTCSDGDACTKDDVCAAGKCGGTAIVCNDGNKCTADSCDPASGCTATNLPDGTTCSDGAVCTTNDACGSGVCVGGPLKNCDDGNVCTTDSCSGQIGCHNKVNSLPCDDGNACTVGDKCGDLVCNPGDVTVCNDDNPCTTDSCDPTSGGCVFVVNNTPCDDGDPCTLADACTDTGCKGTPKVCDPVGYNFVSGQDNCQPIGYCDYADGECKTTTNFAWSGGFQKTPWKTTGGWQIGLATDVTVDAMSPQSGYGSEPYIARTAASSSGNGQPVWMYLTSPVIDLSAYATGGFLDGSTYDKSLIVDFTWYAGYATGFAATLEITADGKTWVASPSKPTVPNGFWNGPYALLADPTSYQLPKAFYTKTFQFRFGYALNADVVTPLTSGLSIDHVQIGVGNCWD